MYLPLVVGFLCLFWYALLYVLSSFAIIFMRKSLSTGCFAFIVFWMSNCYCKCSECKLVPWVGLHFVIVVFPDLTHLFFSSFIQNFNRLTTSNCQFNRSCLKHLQILNL